MCAASAGGRRRRPGDKHVESLGPFTHPAAAQQRARRRHHCRHVLERRGPARPGCVAAQERLGHLAQLDLAADRRGGARDRRRPDAVGLCSRRHGLHPVEHGGRMGDGRPGRVVLRRRIERHLPDRRGQPGAVPVRRLAHLGAVCRGRRAARQGAGGARATSRPEEDRRVRHEGAARLGRRRSDQPGRSARAGS